MNHSPKDKKSSNKTGLVNLYEGLLSMLACKCPRCREGDMFEFKNPWGLRHTMKMNPTCPVCNQPFNPEPGFYFGSSYISYAITVAISGATFFAFWFFVGFPFLENHILHWLISNAVLLIGIQPYLMRVSRTGWLAFFVRYNADWLIHPPAQPERVNKEQENNW
jgi:uncharacterized protein (DUF983 family)